MDLKNKKWSDEQFFKVREEVLKQWPTGKDVDLQEAVDFLKTVPEEKNFAIKLKKAKEDAGYCPVCGNTFGGKNVR